MIKLLIGDCRERLRGLAAGSVQACITSPPYWGLRDYSLEPLVWGGVDGCEHLWGDERTIVMSPHHLDESITSVRGGGHKKAEINASTGQHCQRCNAWRGSLGLEPTPELFVAHLVEVMREVKRVLRDDGVLFMNLGDSYNGAGYSNHHNTRGAKGQNGSPGRDDSNLKPKDLVGIPWRVAFALQADGWWWRSVLPWLKPNCMPESVTDRPSTAHEYWFLLSKSERYYWDADAVRKAVDRDYLLARGSLYRTGENGQDTIERSLPTGKAQSCGVHLAGRNRRTSDTFNESLDELIEQCELAVIHAEQVTRPWLAHLKEIRDNGGMLLDEAGEPLALKFSTKGFSGAHFATFSPDLIEPLIKSGVSERGACPSCGAAWGRIREKSPEYAKLCESEKGNWHLSKSEELEKGGRVLAKTKHGGISAEYITTGWQPRCGCDAGEPVPCVVLDPFAGALTTSLVAERLGHDSVAIEQSDEYAAMGAKRVKDELGTMFTRIEVIPCA